MYCVLDLFLYVILFGEVVSLLLYKYYHYQYHIMSLVVGTLPVPEFSVDSHAVLTHCDS